MYIYHIDIGNNKSSKIINVRYLIIRIQILGYGSKDMAFTMAMSSSPHALCC